MSNIDLSQSIDLSNYNSNNSAKFKSCTLIVTLFIFGMVTKRCQFAAYCFLFDILEIYFHIETMTDDSNPWITNNLHKTIKFKHDYYICRMDTHKVLCQFYQITANWKYIFLWNSKNRIKRGVWRSSTKKICVLIWINLKLQL